MLCLQVIYYPLSIYKYVSFLKPYKTNMFCFDDGLSPRNLAREDQPHFLSFGCFLIMYEWNGWDIFCPLGFWPIMIYSRLEGGCECVQRRCHESRIPGRHNIYDIPSYVIMCHHNMFSCNLFLFKIKEFPRNAWNMTKHHHRGKYIYDISSKLFIF